MDGHTFLQRYDGASKKNREEREKAVEKDWQEKKFKESEQKWRKDGWEERTKHDEEKLGPMTGDFRHQEKGVTEGQTDHPILSFRGALSQKYNWA